MSGGTPAPGGGGGGSGPGSVPAGRVDVRLSGPLWDGRAGPALVRNLRVALVAAAARIETAAAVATPVNLGLLRQSIGYRVEEEGARSSGGYPAAVTAQVGSPISYAPHVEYGTRKHWPPKAPIEAWVRRQLADEVDAMAATDQARERARGFVAGLPGKRSKAQARRLAKLTARERAVQSLTFLVRRGIARHGTEGVGMLRDAIRKNTSWTLRAVEAAVRRWAKDLSGGGGGIGGGSSGASPSPTPSGGT